VAAIQWLDVAPGAVRINGPFTICEGFADPMHSAGDLFFWPGGRIAIADVVQSPEKVEKYDRLEKLRDPSPVHALTVPEISTLVAATGLSEIWVGRYKVEGEVEQQIRASFPEPGDEDRVRAMFRDDLEQDCLGIDVHLEGDEIHFAVPVLCLPGRR